MVAKGFTESAERVKCLKKVSMTAALEVESERAVLIVESHREMEGMLIFIGCAKTLERILNRFFIVIRDDELVMGVITKDLCSAQTYPEFSFEWMEKEPDTMGKRSVDPFKISEAAKGELKEIFKCWKGKTVSDLTSAYTSETIKEAISNGVFTVSDYFYGGIGHVSAGHGKVLEFGFSGLVKLIMEIMKKLDRDNPGYVKERTLYESMTIHYNASTQFTCRYTAKAREMTVSCSCAAGKTELFRTARVYGRVPEHGATNFYEACQTFWFTQTLIQIESSGYLIPSGGFDQHMYPHLKVDHSIPEGFVQELLDCPWVKFNGLNKVRDGVFAQAFTDYGGLQNLIVGGQTDDRLDVTNDVSYMCMAAAAHMQLPQPSFSIRAHRNTPEEFLYRACGVICLGTSVSAVYNDETIIPTPCSRGVPLVDARNYGTAGCAESQSPYKMGDRHGLASVNMVKILELTLSGGENNGRQMGPDTGDVTSFKSVGGVWRAFEKQIQYFVHHVVEVRNSADYARIGRIPPPFLSGLVDDCIGKGPSLQHSGAVCNSTRPQAPGVIDCDNSIYAMRTYVFENKGFTIAQLKDALNHNFGCGCCEAVSDDEARIYKTVKRILSSSGSIDISALQLQPSASQTVSAGDGEYTRIKCITESTTRYGNDVDDVDLLARRCGQIYSCEVEEYKNPKGEIYQAGCYPISTNVLLGKNVGALLDGRLTKQSLADGVSPRQGKDTNGPTAATMPVAELDHENYSNGVLYNRKLPPSVPAGDGGLRRPSTVVCSYLDHRGMHIRSDIVGKNTLSGAQAHPELYKDPVARVAGHSVQFTALAKKVQNDIISRTERVL